MMLSDKDRKPSSQDLHIHVDEISLIQPELPLKPESPKKSSKGGKAATKELPKRIQPKRGASANS
jgi:hypothetical protein